MYVCFLVFLKSHNTCQQVQDSCYFIVGYGSCITNEQPTFNKIKGTLCSISTKSNYFLFPSFVTLNESDELIGKGIFALKSCFLPPLQNKYDKPHNMVMSLLVKYIALLRPCLKW